jgi:outer membrane protein OmpA-like peptidoglycan-associated protein
VSQPGDRAEREADDMAQRVMHMPAGAAGLEGGSRHHGHGAAPGRVIRRAAQGVAGAASAAPVSRTNASQTAVPAGSSGSAMPESVRSFMEPRFGADFSGVRLHSGLQAAQMNRALGAQAFTVGQDIYFGAGASTANLALTAHELAHVVQQTSGVGTLSIQRAIAPTLTVPQGEFHVATVINNAPPGSTRASFGITIDFLPDTDAPYSNQIGLIQIVRDVNSDTGENVEPVSLPASRGDDLRTQTTDATGVEEGFFTDVLHNDEPARRGAGTDFPAGGSLPPQYPFGRDPAQTTPPTPGLSRPFSSGARAATIGYKRSDDPADIKAAQLTDQPGSSGNRNFDFETVAKGEDTLNIFGALKWGFEIRNGQIQNDQGTASGAQSATFDAALERHRNFYVHEPVIFYFDFDSDVLSATEEAKIDTFLAYLGRFPDVQVTPTGFADRRGGRSQYNVDLSLRRAEAVDAALRAKGVPDTQINRAVSSGATESFTPDAVTDQDRDANRRGNRRVVLTFSHP